ncbi:hypothetical protein GCM10017673_16090 [Streptosporangium violaceochromogenes]|nr:hypothetical protein GCM10017673_16090 [Streptosporangium violaceochromogenes]
MNLVPIIATEHHVEFTGRRVFKEVVELGVDVGLHGGSILGCRGGYTGRTGMSDIRGGSRGGIHTSGDRPAYSGVAGLAVPSGFLRDLLRKNVPKG